jgi:hypothetical protein
MSYEYHETALVDKWNAALDSLLPVPQGQAVERDAPRPRSLERVPRMLRADGERREPLDGPESWRVL